jgi:hypothetical protein
VSGAAGVFLTIGANAVLDRLARVRYVERMKTLVFLLPSLLLIACGTSPVVSTSRGVGKNDNCSFWYLESRGQPRTAYYEYGYGWYVYGGTGGNPGGPYKLLPFMDPSGYVYQIMPDMSSQQLDLYIQNNYLGPKREVTMVAPDSGVPYKLRIAGFCGNTRRVEFAVFPNRTGSR